MERKPEQAQRVEITMDDDQAQGSYINLAMVNHSGDEFTFDFIYVSPNSPKAKLRARLISSPGHTKRLMLALQENVRRYEERFGEIDINRGLAAPDVSKEVGHA